MNTKTLSMIGALVAFVVTSGLGVMAQNAPQGQMKPPQSGSMGMGKMMQKPSKGGDMTKAKMMQSCQEMKAQKQKMKDDMKTQDAQLTQQIAEMNGASEEKKMGLMASVVTNMVEQRITMDARKTKMEEEMMQHMMQHMQMGKETMSQCPMMQGMDEKSGAAQKEMK